MFIYANILLLGLFAGVLYLGGTGLARRVPLPALLSPAGEERLLFGGWGGKWRERLGMACFLLGLGAHLFQIAFLHSQLIRLYPDTVGFLDEALDVVLGLCILFKILLGTRYNLYQLGFGFGVYFVLRWVHFNSHNLFFIVAVFLVMAAKDVPLRKSLKLFLAVSGGSTAFIMLSSTVGFLGLRTYIEQFYDYGGYYKATTLGYTHWNAAGGLLLGAAMGWALLRQERMSWADYLAIAAAGALTFKVIDSKTSGLLIFGVLLCCLAARFLPRLKGWRALPWLGAGFSALLALASGVGVQLLYGEIHRDPETGISVVTWWPPLLRKIDDLLTGRLYLMMVALRDFQVKIAGQMLPDYPPIDNCYLNSMLAQGPVAFALLWAGACAAVFQLLRARKLLPGLMLLVALVYALMEVQYLHINSNPTLLLLAGVVWGGSLADKID